MAEVFPRRNLGSGEYWGRVVEDRIVDAEKKWTTQGQFLSGDGRAADTMSDGIARRIQEVEQIATQLPIVATGTAYDTSFPLTAGWQTLAAVRLQMGTKTHASIMAIGDLYVRDSGSGGGAGSFVWPFPLSTVTSEYGPRLDVGTFHEGMDFAGGAAVVGSNIPASGAGTVDTVNFSSGFGNYVILAHGNFGAFDLYTLYGHMQSFPSLSVGATVTQGQTLGQVGNTGNSYGAHLHFETHMVPAGGSIIWDNSNPTYGSSRTAQDPRNFIDLYGSGSGVIYDPDIKCRLVIEGVNSREFLPFRDLYATTGRLNTLFPVWGRELSTTGDVYIQLQAYTTSGITSSSASKVLLSVQGIFT